MFSGDAIIQTLRDALRVSPDNLPLRQHLAETLLALGRLDEAEQEYRTALAKANDNDTLKVGLANVFYQQGKNGQALVIIEALLKQAQVQPRAYLLHARLLLRTGDVERAIRQYREAIDADPSLADADFAASLGIDVDPDNSDVVEGKLRAALEDVHESPDGGIERRRMRKSDVDQVNQDYNRPPERALEHFREALRLDPSMEWAREGVAAALKARNSLNRQLRRYDCLDMAGQSASTRTAPALTVETLLRSVANLARFLR